MKLRFTTSARTEFLVAFDTICQENPTAAQAFFHRATQVLKRLEPFPYSGRSLPEFPDLPYREIIVPPYRFIYRVIDNTVWIVTVRHGARLPVSPEF